METFDWAKSYRGNLDWLKDRTVLLVKHGSHAYGLNTPESDLDVKGVAVPPKEYFLGYLKRFEQAESSDPDMVIYDIRKFFQLAADCNPNIIEVLWVDDSDVIQENWIGASLRHWKHSFLSKKARHTFSGYAHAQLKRIKTHKKWLLNPPTHKPTRAEFGLPETSLLSKDILGAVDAVIRPSDDRVMSDEEFDIGVLRFGVNVMEVYRKERSYHNAARQFTQYERWKANRNPERAALEARYGYDAKHAMHLVRLMKMCREILVDEKVVVKRPDREELLAIRAGAMAYEEMVEWAERQDAEIAALAAKSRLPHSPDRSYLDGLCACWVENYLSGRV